MITMTAEQKLGAVKKIVRLWLDNAAAAKIASEPETKDYWMHADREYDMGHLLDVLEA